MPNVWGEVCRALDGSPKPHLEPLTSWLTDENTSARQFLEWADDPPAPAGSGFTSGRGAHATPWPLADWIGRQMGGPHGTVLDPACGCGHLLAAAALGNPSAPPESWYGWDVSRHCTDAARIALWLATQRRYRVGDFCNIRPLDALFDAPPVKVDAILANPPFVSIRALNRSWGRQYVYRLRARFSELRGNFDLYVPFLLRFPQWLSQSGRFACIVPATFWSGDYARCARQSLVPRIRSVYRVEGRRLFRGVSVSPHILLGEMGSPTSMELFRIHLENGACQVHSEGRASATTDFGVGYPAAAESWPDTVPLGELAEIQGGTVGYQAKSIAKALIEQDEVRESEALPFVMTRSIAPYRIRSGPVRFMGRRLERPLLPVAALTAGKRRLFRSTKIVVAGVCRQIEAALDTRGVALGVGVYAVLPHRVRPELVLALLNSQAITNWYRRTFLGKELSGGYFGLNCSTLRKIPVPAAWLEERHLEDYLVELVRKRCDADQPDALDRLDRAIERAVVTALLG